MTPEEFIHKNIEWSDALQQGFVTVEVALQAVQLARQEDEQ